MKTIKLISILAFGLGFALTADAQVAMTSTYLSSAITNAGAQTIAVGSTTGISVGNDVLIEDGSVSSAMNGATEVVEVEAVPTSTTLYVRRGAVSTVASPHAKGVVVIAGPPQAFGAIEPAGSCTPGAGYAAYTPYVNTKTGNQWLCSTITNTWVPGFFNVDGQTSATTAVASVAGATNPSGPLFHVTGTNAITAWGSSTTAGLGAGGGSSTLNTIGANFCVIPDGLFTTTATNNIALASTAVVNKILCFAWDATNKKYVPSY